MAPKMENELTKKLENGMETLGPCEGVVLWMVLHT